VTLLIIALAAAPALAIAVFIYWKDKYDPEPKKLLYTSFALGMASCLPAVLFTICFKALGFDEASHDVLFSLVSCIIAIGLSEEGSKYLMVRYYAFKKPAFNEPFDGITYSVMVSLGFATLENFLYVFKSDSPLQVALLRMIFSVPGHAAFAVIMGYFLGLLKMGKTHYGWVGLFAAATVHGIFDFCLFNAEQYSGLMLFFIVVFYLMMRFSLKAIRIHQQQSPFKNQH